LPNGKIRFAAIYGNAAVMGIDAEALKKTSLWEFLAQWSGYVSANTPEDEKGLSSKEKDELWDWLNK